MSNDKQMPVTEEMVEANKDTIPGSDSATVSTKKSTAPSGIQILKSAAVIVGVMFGTFTVTTSAFDFFYAHSNGIDKKIEYCSLPTDGGYLSMTRTDRKEIVYDIYVEPKGFVYRHRFLSGWNESTCEEIESRRRSGMKEMK